jgi:hypothetical protein
MKPNEEAKVEEGKSKPSLIAFRGLNKVENHIIM